MRCEDFLWIEGIRNKQLAVDDTVACQCDTGCGRVWQLREPRRWRPFLGRSARGPFDLVWVRLSKQASIAWLALQERA